jgi:hypothetical protein
MTLSDITLLTLLVQLEQGGFAATDASSWAQDALLEGFDSVSLRVLAGLGPDAQSFEVRPLLRDALRELGITPPVGEPLLRAYASAVAQELHDGHITADVAVERIHETVISPLHHPDDLMPLCYLWEGNTPDCAGSVDGPERDALILIETKRLLLPESPFLRSEPAGA